MNSIHFLFDEIYLLIKKMPINKERLAKIGCNIEGVVVVVAKSCPILSKPHGLQPTRLLCPWDFPGKSIAVDCHFLLQGIFLTRD